MKHQFVVFLYFYYGSHQRPVLCTDSMIALLTKRHPLTDAAEKTHRDVIVIDAHRPPPPYPPPNVANGMRITTCIMLETAVAMAAPPPLFLFQVQAGKSIRLIYSLFVSSPP